MNTTRSLRIIVCAALIIATLVALQAFKPSAKSEASASYTGRGDYHRYESQFFKPDASVPEFNRPYVGMGDLRRFEGAAPTQAYVGMGDLHRYEAQQEMRDLGENTSPKP